MFKRKPEIKPMIDANGNHVDDIVACGHCGAYICFPEDEEKELIERCDHCGMIIDWKGDGADE